MGNINTTHALPSGSRNLEGAPQTTTAPDLRLVSGHSGNARVESTPLASPSNHEIVNVIQGGPSRARNEGQQELDLVNPLVGLLRVSRSSHQEIVETYQALLVEVTQREPSALVLEVLRSDPHLFSHFISPLLGRSGHQETIKAYLAILKNPAIVSHFTHKFWNEFSEPLKNYLTTLDTEKKYISTQIQALNLKPEEDLEKDLFDDFRDPITTEYIMRPVVLPSEHRYSNTRYYNFETVLFYLGNEDPYSRRKFTNLEISPAPELFDTLENAIEQLHQNRNENAAKESQIVDS